LRRKGLAAMSNPYILPKGNIAIAFSGGRTSAYMLHQILEANGDLPDRVVVSFQNTGREMPETLDFVQECSDRWGVRVVWLEYRPKKPLFEVVSHNSASRKGEPFDALIGRKKALPNIAQKFCTQELKVLTARRYLFRHLGWKSWVNARGIRADEDHRATESKDKRITNWHPLVCAKVKKEHVASFWARQPFGLRLPSVGRNNPFGNCDGCFLKSEESKTLLARYYPERFSWWEANERAMGATFRDRQPLRQTRKMVERQGD